METRKLGNSDLQLTPVGFGAWAIGGGGWEFGWGEQEDTESVTAILKALDLGVNWIDTAAVYGTGHSEEIVAQALQQWRGKRPYVFTKCTLRWDENRKVYPDHSAASIRKECEDSLRRLKTEIIDLYQMHWPPKGGDAELDEAWRAMSELKVEGKVRWIGVSNFTAEQIARIAKIAPGYFRPATLFHIAAASGGERTSALPQKWDRSDQLRADGFRSADGSDDERTRGGFACG